MDYHCTVNECKCLSFSNSRSNNDDDDATTTTTTTDSYSCLTDDCGHGREAHGIKERTAAAVVDPDERTPDESEFVESDIMSSNDSKSLDKLDNTTVEAKKSQESDHDDSGSVRLRIRSPSQEAQINTSSSASRTSTSQKESGEDLDSSPPPVENSPVPGNRTVEFRMNDSGSVRQRLLNRSPSQEAQINTSSARTMTSQKESSQVLDSSPRNRRNFNENTVQSISSSSPSSDVSPDVIYPPHDVPDVEISIPTPHINPFQTLNNSSQYRGTRPPPALVMNTGTGGEISQLPSPSGLLRNTASMTDLFGSIGHGDDTLRPLLNIPGLWIKQKKASRLFGPALMTGISEYFIYVLNNDLRPRRPEILIAVEQSNLISRTFCHSIRRSTLQLLDINHNEILRIHRPFRCTLFFGALMPQTIEVYSGSASQEAGILLGSVVQVTSYATKFDILDASGKVLYRISGKNLISMCSFTMNILRKDQLVGTIEKKFSGPPDLMGDSSDNMALQFPSMASARDRGLIFAASMLVHYVVFETGQFSGTM